MGNSDRVNAVGRAGWCVYSVEFLELLPSMQLCVRLQRGWGQRGDSAGLSPSFSCSTCFSPADFWDGVPAQPLQFPNRLCGDDLSGTSVFSGMLGPLRADHRHQLLAF